MITLKYTHNILTGEDIEGHLELGAPNDEYLSEAKEIIDALNTTNTPFSIEALSSIISKVWKKSFNLSDEELALRLPAIHRAAQRLMENL